MPKDHPRPNPDYMKERPKKKVLPKSAQRQILKEIKRYIYTHLPPKTRLYRKRLFGSLAKGKFGLYLNGTWKGRENSDVDVLFVVDDDFKVPKRWKLHFRPKDTPSRVYNVADLPIEIKYKEKGNIITKKILINLQYFIVPISYARKKESGDLSDPWGVPLRLRGSINPFITL